MAKYGASDPYFAIIKTEPENGLPTYEGGVKLARLISSSDNPTYSKAELYADNRLAEEVEEFVSASIEVSLDDVELKNKALIYGATLSEQQELEYKGSDTAPYGGYAFYAAKMKSGVKKYVGVFYPKVKASMGGVTHNTKGESITFAPDSVTFSASETEAYTWKIEKEFTAEEEAKTWIKSKLGISAV